MSWWAGPQRGGGGTRFRGQDTDTGRTCPHGQDVSLWPQRVPHRQDMSPGAGVSPSRAGHGHVPHERHASRPPRLRVGHGSVVTPACPPWAGHVPVDRTCPCGHSVSPMGQDTSLVGRTCPHGQDVSLTERTCPQRQDMPLWSQRVPTDRTRPPRRRGHQHRSGNHRGSPVSPCPQAPTVSPLCPLSRRSPPRR